MISTTTQLHPALNTNLYHTTKSFNPLKEFSFSTQMSIQTSSIHNSNPLHGIPSGLQVLRSNGFIKLPSRKAQKQLCIPNRPYEEAISLLRRFADSLSLQRPGQPAAIAWISRDSSPLIPSATALASRGFDLEHLVFIESSLPLRALRCACEENFFDAILYDEPATQASLHIARRWLKPPHQPAIAKGSEISLCSKEKLIVFLD
jgi:hypothetical protein